MRGDALAAAHCPTCLAEYRAGFDVCADCSTPLEPGPAPDHAERGEVELIHAPPAPAPEPPGSEPSAWDEANARVWGEEPFEPDLDALIDVDEDDVDVDETGYALVTTAPVLTAYEGAERLSDAGVDARVVVRDPLFDGDPAPDQAELRVPWDRLDDARRILGLVV
jgi:hypothetical protein